MAVGFSDKYFRLLNKFQSLNENFLLKIIERRQNVFMGGVSGIRLSSSYNSNYDSKKGETPFQRAIRILKGSLGEVKDRLDDPMGLYTSKKIFPSHCDVLIIGGGAIGSSVAYWLKQRTGDGVRVVVVDKDSTYKECSTALSVGGVRQQFSLKENIEMSVFGAQFLRNIDDYLGVNKDDPPEIFFNPYGYLTLASPAGASILEENALLQTSLGAKNELLSPENLKKKFPWLNTEEIALGCYGLENEGWFDPWCLLQAFKNKAISLGTEYIDGEVTGFEMQLTPQNFEVLRAAQIACPDGVIRNINFAILVIAGGPQSGHIANLAGVGSGKKDREVPLPVEPRKRYVYCFHCPEGPGLNTPLTIDPTGTYFRREGLCGNFISGRSPSEDEEPDASNLVVDDQYFDDKVWPVIAHRVPAFEKLKVTSSWAGYYDYNTFDQNVIIGRHPYYDNMFFCTGCSGHGIQQSPALGRAMMELIINGKYSTLDLSRFSFDRLIANEKVVERNIV